MSGALEQADMGGQPARRVALSRVHDCTSSGMKTALGNNTCHNNNSLIIIYRYSNDNNNLIEIYCNGIGSSNNLIIIVIMIRSNNDNLTIKYIGRTRAGLGGDVPPLQAYNVYYYIHNTPLLRVYHRTCLVRMYILVV